MEDAAIALRGEQRLKPYCLRLLGCVLFRGNQNLTGTVIAYLNCRGLSIPAVDVRAESLL